MKSSYSVHGLLSFAVLSVSFVIGFLILASRLKVEQVDGAAEYRRQMQSQSFRRVQTSGLRGRIVDRNGVVLAGNRTVVNIAVNPESYRAKARGETTEKNILKAIARAEEIIGRPSILDQEDVRRHLKQSLAMPLVAWRDISGEELARFSERQYMLDGFECSIGSERHYPHGMLAAHVLGRVGRDRLPFNPGDERINYIDKELCGRDGLELQYDTLLRGMPGEERVLVDALGFATEREVLVEARNGFDLKLTLDYRLQKAAEDALRGLRGAFVAVDPRDGGVRAMVSVPSFDPRECVPVFPRKLYERYSKDPAKPLLNRAVAGQYAPGSTFKPLTALAALSVGIDPDKTRECCGYYEAAGMRIRCARTWGHGEMDLVNAIKNSCNPYFCEIGVKAGTNAINTVCRKFGLGVKTGIDFPIEGDGLVPDAAEKAKRDPSVRWNSGDVAQTSIGQGLLLVTPLQMSLVAAGLGSGKLPAPHLVEGYASTPKDIDIPERDFAYVAEGMRKVVAGGTGRLAGERVEAEVMGKTGTAEVGSRTNRRKNTWFIAYVTPTAKSAVQEPIAVALVIENGDTGGSTSAPKVGEILRAYYGESEG
ncbi:MAG: hypothetical protein IKC27_03255 [Kiritimatiellae bacterium]|nr:hypothetical protein [Kiritimatiellia bacterium]